MNTEHMNECAMNKRTRGSVGSEQMHNDGPGTAVLGHLSYDSFRICGNLVGNQQIEGNPKATIRKPRETKEPWQSK